MKSVKLGNYAARIGCLEYRKHASKYEMKRNF